jgi:hypothetical protein
VFAGEIRDGEDRIVTAEKTGTSLRYLKLCGDGEVDEEGDGNAGSVERVEKQKQLSHVFPQPLGNLANNARFPHFHRPATTVYLQLKTGRETMMTTMLTEYL